MMSTLELNCTVESLTANLRPYIRTIFSELAKANPENASLLSDFIIAEQNEQNIAESTKEWKIRVLTWLSTHLSHKSYRQMTKQDIMAYLNKLRKSEADDPMHKWIGTYNNKVMMLNKFFRW